MSVRAIPIALALAACGDDGVQPTSRCSPTEGVVSGVHDGDTITLGPVGEEVRVRYLLVDTPELGSTNVPADCFADEARRLNQQLVLGQFVELEYDEGQCFDSFGERSLAYVTVMGHMVNRILVERGYAVVLNDPPGNRPPYRLGAEFEGLEAQARANRAGLWGICE